METNKITPNLLKELHTKNVSKRYTEEQQLNIAIINILEKAVDLLKKDPYADYIEIKGYSDTYRKIYVHDFEIEIELKRLGYKTSAETTGFEQETTEHYYLYFK